MLRQVKLRMLCLGLLAWVSGSVAPPAQGAEWQELPKTDDLRLDDSLSSRERAELQKFQAYALDTSGNNWARLPRLSQIKTDANLLIGDLSIVADIAKVREIQNTLAGDAFTQNYLKTLRAIENLESKLFDATDPNDVEDLQDIRDGWRATLARQEKLFFTRLDQVTPDVRNFYFSQLKAIFDRRGIAAASPESQDFRTQSLAYIQTLYTQNSFQLTVPVELSYGSSEATWNKYTAALTELSWTYPTVQTFAVKTADSVANPFRKGTVGNRLKPNEFNIILDMSANDLLDLIKLDLNFAYPVRVFGSVQLPAETKDETTLLTGVCLRAEESNDALVVKSCP